MTLQGALGRTVVRVLLGLGAGLPLGVLLGSAMGWSRRVDLYVHPVFALVRSIPPLALITYLMLWLGHGEAHLVVPVVYGVFTVMAVGSYQAVRDVPTVYVLAGQVLGLQGGALWARVVLPAAAPGILAAVRLALMTAWMTAVGAEMLMADDGIGHLVVGGGLWSARLQVGVDASVVMVGVAGLAAAGWLTDTLARGLSGRLTAWARP